MLRPWATIGACLLGHSAQGAGMRSPVDGDHTGLADVPAIEGNVQQLALDDDGGIVQQQINRQRVPHAHMLGRDQHAAHGNFAADFVIEPAKICRPQSNALLQNCDVRTVRRRGSKRTGNAKMAIAAVTMANHRKNIAERKIVTGAVTMRVCLHFARCDRNLAVLSP